MNQRQRKSLLWAIEHFFRHSNPLGQLSKDVLLLAAAHLPLRPQAGDPLDERMVEDGHAHFQ